LAGKKKNCPRWTGRILALGEKSDGLTDVEELVIEIENRARRVSESSEYISFGEERANKKLAAEVRW